LVPVCDQGLHEGTGGIIGFGGTDLVDQNQFAGADQSNRQSQQAQTTGGSDPDQQRELTPKAEDAPRRVA
jgi:hypothetical protein